MKQLKYFTIKEYEDLIMFTKRVKYETGHLDYLSISCSETMGKGIQVLHLISRTNINDQVKLEVLEKDMYFLKAIFQETSIDTKNPSIRKNPSNKMFSHMDTGLRDLY